MEDLEISKMFEGTLILNWKTGEIRILKKSLKKEGPFEIPIRLKIKVLIPQFKEIVAEGEIEVPENKVKEITIHSL